MDAAFERIISVKLIFEESSIYIKKLNKINPSKINSCKITSLMVKDCNFEKYDLATSFRAQSTESK